MRRFFNKDFNVESDFSWKSTIYTAIVGVLIASALGGFGWMVNCCLKFEAVEKRVISLDSEKDEPHRVLHMRITKEQEARTNEFERLISRQLVLMEKILEEQSKILHDLHKEK